MRGAVLRRLLVDMTHKAIVQDGKIVWLNGEPQAKEIGAPTLVGLEYSDFKREYLAHYDKYVGNREANIKWCEQKFKVSRHDHNTKCHKEKRIRVGYGD